MTSNCRCALRALLLLVAVPLMMAAAAGAAGTTRTETVRVEDESRSLAFLLMKLEARLHTRITYEDPPYAYAGDLQDVTSQVASDPISWKREGRQPILVPAISSLEVTFNVDPASGLPSDPAAVVQAAIDAHSAAGNPGRFRLLRDETGLHVVPTAVKDRNGQWQPVHSVLDARIDLPAEERTWVATLQAVVAAAGSATGTRISPLMFAGPGVLDRLTLGASGEPAREVLAKVLARFNSGVSWRLFYDFRQAAYALNLAPVSTK